MMANNSIPSALKMLVRLTVAVVLSLAPLKVRAASLDSAEPAQQASRLAARAMAEEDPEAAVVAAFQALNLWSRAFQADGAERHLCKARSLLAAIGARPDVDGELRASLEQSRDALPRCPKPGRSHRPKVERVRPSERLPDLLDVPPPQVAQVAQVARAHARGHAPQGEGRDREQSVLPPPRVQAEALDQPQRSRRQALHVGGGISMALGLLALGVMTPFASRDAAIAREIDSLTAKSEAAGGLTREEDQRAAELAEQSRLTFRSSLALGLTGGIATVLGASLLIVGQRRRSLTLAPHADRNSASLSLQGWF